MDEALVLTLDPAYFRLSGGMERWLYRLVRKHGGRQPGGWRFEMRHLHLKSGSLQRPSDFAIQVRPLARRQTLRGYDLCVNTVVATSGSSSGPSPDDARGICPQLLLKNLWMAWGRPRWITRTTLGGSPAEVSVDRPH